MTSTRAPGLPQLRRQVGRAGVQELAGITKRPYVVVDRDSAGWDDQAWAAAAPVGEP
jgi:hypothetical protein